MCLGLTCIVIIVKTKNLKRLSGRSEWITQLLCIAFIGNEGKKLKFGDEIVA